MCVKPWLINCIDKFHSKLPHACCNNDHVFFCKEIEFKNYLRGVGDPGTHLLFKFRSGTNGLNEELGSHRAKNDDRQCNCNWI